MRTVLLVLLFAAAAFSQWMYADCYTDEIVTVFVAIDNGVYPMGDGEYFSAVNECDSTGGIKRYFGCWWGEHTLPVTVEGDTIVLCQTTTILNCDSLVAFLSENGYTIPNP